MPNNKQTSNTQRLRGITLTELLIASTMIGIVMIGIASFGLVTKQLHSSTSHASVVAMRTKTVMARIANDVELAVGDLSDPGIITSETVAGDSICFRHDVDATPDDYTDDQWICYFQGPGAETNLDLCGGPPTPEAAVPVLTSADCDVNAPGGTRQKIFELEDNPPVFFRIVEDASDRLLHVEITLQALYDHNEPFHAVTNPRYTLTTQVHPEAHSR